MCWEVKKLDISDRRPHVFAVNRLDPAVKAAEDHLPAFRSFWVSLCPGRLGNRPELDEHPERVPGRPFLDDLPA